jgi:cobalt-zinc-cadmium efflux system membrane fusion protein
VVVERYLSAGERVEEKPVFKLARIDPLRVEVIVPAARFGSIRVGELASVKPDLPNAAPVAASVALVDRVVDAASNTFRVRLTLPNADLRLPAGLRCRISFGGSGGAGSGRGTPARRNAPGHQSAGVQRQAPPLRRPWTPAAAAR